MSADDAYALVLPFVVCASKGGPYNDEDFSAGFQVGQIFQAMSTLPGEVVQVEYTVRTMLLKQLDLVAMHFGFTVELKASEHVDDWTLWTATRKPHIEFDL